MIDPNLQLIITIVLAIIAASPGIWANYTNWRKQRAELLASKRTQPMDETEQGLRIARQAAEDVLTKSTRIKELEDTISSLKDRLDELETNKRHVEEELADVKRKVGVLEKDKSRLETENSAQLQRIAALEEENRKKDELIKKMQARITKLEGILKEKGIPVPPNGNGNPC